MAGFKYAFSVSAEDVQSAAPPGTVTLVGKVLGPFQLAAMLKKSQIVHFKGLSVAAMSPTMRFACSSTILRSSRSLELAHVAEDCYPLLHVVVTIPREFYFLHYCKRASSVGNTDGFQPSGALFAVISFDCCKNSQSYWVENSLLTKSR